MRVLPKSYTFAAVRVLVVAYLAVCILLYAWQGHFIFVPSNTVFATPPQFRCPLEEVSIGSNHLNGYWVGGTGDQTVIMHHGNGGNVSYTLEPACLLSGFGFKVLTFDPRGYGKSRGDFPSEQTVYEDADSAWQYVTQQKHIAPKDVLLYGFSIGAAVAIESAIRHPNAGALIEESGFTSIYDMGKRNSVFRLFPLSLIVTQKMDSIHKVPQLKMPALFIHGAADPIIPVSMAEALYAAAPLPKKLLIVRGAGHGDAAVVGGEEYKHTVLEFAKSLRL
jgi:uncharacterized protein